MKITYVGMFEAVLVRDWLDANGDPREVTKGVPVEIPDEIAVRLLDQTENWEEAPARAKPKPTESTAAPDAGDIEE